VDAFCKFFDKIDQKLETVCVNLADLVSKDLLICLDELIIDELKLILALTGNFSKVVNVAASDWVQIERNVSEQQLNTNKVLVQNTQFQRLLSPLVLDIRICSVLQ
jgi:hypothetical protein